MVQANVCYYDRDNTGFQICQWSMFQLIYEQSCEQETDSWTALQTRASQYIKQIFCIGAFVAST